MSMVVFPVPDTSSTLGPVRADGKRAITIHKSSGVRETVITTKEKADDFIKAKKKNETTSEFCLLTALLGGTFAFVGKFTNYKNTAKAMPMLAGGLAVLGVSIAAMINSHSGLKKATKALEE